MTRDSGGSGDGRGDHLRRRRVVRLGAAGLAGALAGCGVPSGEEGEDGEGENDEEADGGEDGGAEDGDEEQEESLVAVRRRERRR